MDKQLEEILDDYKYHNTTVFTEEHMNMLRQQAVDKIKELFNPQDDKEK